MLDPNSRPLVRLFRYDGMEWDPPDVKFRKLRVDPPDGFKDQFAVLYTADTLPAVAMECRVLQVSALDDSFKWSKDLAEQYSVVRYAFSEPALFIPIDGNNRDLLGLSWRGGKLDHTYLPFQKAALELHQRFGKIIHGLSWQSYHRHQLGRVYAIWHEHKSTIDLSITSSKPYSKLIDDSEWSDFLNENPGIEQIDKAP
ncbi:RES domain-containing protein [Xanthomonas hortorum]|uniref:RES domain-containing protein n=1 Tax=Xanthomonas hortorum TaxID=56454 RepID=UPI0021152D32|nr:RES domain-containing protein [Xanthomonas hortorum]UUF03352.1 RES domain-containing protein [Xanthomonas hortorum pv. pelargonii]UXM99491.1 RES domain-containing protein [Xanthomonas hortorum pv. pelargonii]